MRIPTSVVLTNLLFVSLLIGSHGIGYKSINPLRFTTSLDLLSDTETTGQQDDHRGSGRVEPVQLTNMFAPQG